MVVTHTDKMQRRGEMEDAILFEWRKRRHETDFRRKDNDKFRIATYEHRIVVEKLKGSGMKCMGIAFVCDSVPGSWSQTAWRLVTRPRDEMIGRICGCAI
jgi:hypothetical protein